MEVKKRELKAFDRFLILIMAVCLVVLLVAGTGLVKRFMSYRVGEQAADTAVELAGAQEEVTADLDPYQQCEKAISGIRLESLVEVNSDIVGWVVIPRTSISYPVVLGEDNSYYLTHTWNGEVSRMGSIFMDSRNRLQDVSSDEGNALADFNTVLYGHRMGNGKMFAGLKYYKTEDYLAEHPYVGLVLARPSEADGSGELVYSRYILPIFSVFFADTTSDYAAEKTYRLNTSSAEESVDRLETWKGQSSLDTGVTPAEDSQVVTLSTCTGVGHSKRLVVMCCTKVEE